MSERNWTCYCNEDGEPWAIFLDGHDHDIRKLRSKACRAEMREAFIKFAGDIDEDCFAYEMTIGRYWIRDGSTEDLDESSPDYPWVFCKENQAGAHPITGVKF